LFLNINRFVMESQKERMLAGKPYLAFDTVLFNERQHAKNLLHAFNTLPPGAVEERNQILLNLLGKTGKEFFIEPPFRCDYGYNISLGENFYANYNLIILDCARVIIGDNVFTGPNVGIYTAGHPVHHEMRNSGYEYALPVTIGNNVWLGGHVVINPGVTIGENSVIGSGSVVTRDIPAGVVAAGNPCRVIRRITDEEKGKMGR
jgi:acetyltransferase-like isoleucine patch superfamily enzyme